MSGPNLYMPTLEWFKEEQIKKLSEHHDRKRSWREEDINHLADLLGIECNELDEVLPNPFIVNQTVDYEAIIKECADVANFAMMIADRARILADTK